MEYRKNYNGEYLVRLDVGEEIHDKMLEFCKINNVKSAYFHGIGACSDVIFSVYLPDKKIFKEEKLSGILELISIMGNISKDKNEFFAHSHATFSFVKNEKISLLAGHLKSAVISHTGEFIVTPCDFVIKRKFDENIGIDVWDLSE